MKCDYCGKDESLPFVCNYCGGAYCADHRLPEAHQCKGDLTRKRTIAAPPQTTFSWQTSSVTYPRAQPARTSKVFSRIEVRDILIAWLAIGFAVGVAWSGGVIFGNLNPLNVAVLMGVALVTVGPGFIFHELSHKFVARHYGFWAEFRMWPQMLLMAIVLALVTFFFAAPGATYISGEGISKEENGIISLAGPLINGLIALLFLPLFLFTGGIPQVIGAFGLYVNVVLGAFNLLPLGPLDGTKVFKWNKILWVVFFGIFGSATYVVYTQVVPHLFG